MHQRKQRHACTFMDLQIVQWHQLLLVEFNLNKNNAKSIIEKYNVLSNGEVSFPVSWIKLLNTKKALPKKHLLNKRIISYLHFYKHILKRRDNIK